MALVVLYPYVVPVSLALRAAVARPTRNSSRMASDPLVAASPTRFATVAVGMELYTEIPRGTCTRSGRRGDKTQPVYHVKCAALRLDPARKSGFPIFEDKQGRTWLPTRRHRASTVAQTCSQWAECTGAAYSSRAACQIVHIALHTAIKKHVMMPTILLQQYQDGMVVVQVRLFDLHGSKDCLRSE